MALARAQTAARNKADSGSNGYDMPLSDEELRTFDTQQAAGRFVSDLLYSADGDRQGLAFVMVSNNLSKRELIVRRTPSAGPKLAVNIAASVDKATGYMATSIEDCDVQLTYNEYSALRGALSGADGKAEFSRIAGAPVAEADIAIETQVVTVRLENSPDADRIVSDATIKAAIESAINALAKHEMIVDFITLPLPRVPRSGEATATAVPARAKVGESVTLTPNGVIEHPPCDGDATVYRPVSATEMEEVGNIDGRSNWTTPPLTSLACAPGPSSAPVTVALPMLRPGDYLLCFGACAKLTVIA
jgi:hypothetical protein